MELGREIRASCEEPSSTKRAKSREPASPYSGNVSDEEQRPSSQKVEGRTEPDLVQDEVDEAKRLLEEAHVKRHSGFLRRSDDSLLCLS